METTKSIEEKMADKIKILELSIKPTIDSRSQFETNTRNVFMLDVYKMDLDHLNKWKKNIGKTVYKYLKSFSYSETLETDVLNPIDTTPIVFSEELYEKFKMDLIQNRITYHTNQLIKGSLSESSTSKLSNLQFEWKIECVQKLIKFYNYLIGNEYF